MRPNEIKEHAIIRFILTTIAEGKQSKESNRANDGLGFIHNTTIEHIIDKDKEADNVYSIGNLLLLERDVHVDVKNEDEKKQMYEKSKITVSKQFFDEYPDYDETKILERKKKILTSFYELII